MIFYRIRKTGTEEFLSTARRKTIWTGVGAAKNSYNKHVNAGWRGTPKFDDQVEWELVKVVMVPEDEYQELLNEIDDLDTEVCQLRGCP